MMRTAEITGNGAILLGQYVVCDAHSSRPLRVVTHAHSDHLLGLSQSLAECEQIIATPVTKELIGILKGKKLSEPIKGISYGSSIEYQEERLTLYDAGHIIGSAQVLVEEPTGERILYTGDFKLPAASIVNSDILVIEATYGNPANVREFEESIEDELLDLVKRLLKEDSVHIFGYYGKLHEVIRILNSAEIEVPIVVSTKVFDMLEACRRWGIELSGYVQARSEKGRRALRERHLGVHHVGASKWLKIEGFKIFLSGWQFDLPYRQTGEREYTVALSDHSDFNGLIQYVEQSGPRLVITDNYRVGDAPSLAKEIKNRLGIEAIAMP